MDICINFCKILSTVQNQQLIFLQEEIVNNVRHHVDNVGRVRMRAGAS